MTTPAPDQQEQTLYIYARGFARPMAVPAGRARAEAETTSRIFAGTMVFVLTLAQAADLMKCDSTQHEAYLADKANVLLPVPKPVWDSEESLSGVSW